MYLLKYFVYLYFIKTQRKMNTETNTEERGWGIIEKEFRQGVAERVLDSSYLTWIRFEEAVDAIVHTLNLEKVTKLGDNCYTGFEGLWGELTELTAVLRLPHFIKICENGFAYVFFVMPKTEIDENSCVSIITPNRKSNSIQRITISDDE